MYTEGFEQWFKTNKNLTAPMGEWNKAATDIYKRMAEQNIALISENFERLSEQLKKFTNIKKPEDILAFQKESVTENINAMIEGWQKLAHMEIESFDAYMKLWTSAFRETATKSYEKFDKFEKEKDKEKVR